MFNIDITGKNLNRLIGQYESEIQSKYSANRHMFKIHTENDIIFTEETRHKMVESLLISYLRNGLEFTADYRTTLIDRQKSEYNCPKLYGLAENAWISRPSLDPDESLNSEYYIQCDGTMLNTEISLINDLTLEQHLKSRIYSTTIVNETLKTISSVQEYKQWIIANLVLKLLSYHNTYLGDGNQNAYNEESITDFFTSPHFNPEFESHIINSKTPPKNMPSSASYRTLDLFNFNKIWTYTLLRLETTNEWLETAYQFQKNLQTISPNQYEYIGKLGSNFSNIFENESKYVRDLQFSEQDYKCKVLTYYGVPFNFLIKRGRMVSQMETIVMSNTTQNKMILDYNAAYKKYTVLQNSILPEAKILQAIPGEFVVNLEKNNKDQIFINIFINSVNTQFKIEAGLTEEIFKTELETAINLILETNEV